MIIIKYYETCPFVTDKCSWKYEKVRTPGDMRIGVELTKREAREIIRENNMVKVVSNQYGEVWETRPVCSHDANYAS